MRDRQWPGWYGVDIFCGAIIAALSGVCHDLTALLIMHYYNPSHLRLTRGHYTLDEALIAMIFFAPFGAATGLAVSAIGDRRSAKRRLRRLRFLLWFIGPALAILAVGNLISLWTGNWDTYFMFPCLLPVWAMLLARVMTGWQSPQALSAADAKAASDPHEKQ
jgi:hypothetical protein